jgi:GMP synthase-like glutamine amidotransferase
VVVRAALIGNRDDTDPGLVGHALRRRGYSFVELAREDHVSWDVAPTDVDLVVSLGSSWSTYWPEFEAETSAERHFLLAAHGEQVPVLGICFGAQQLATALGGAVSRLHKHEIGWHEVSAMTESGSGESLEILAGQWFQWHYDGFSVPSGATTLAHSPVSPQAFRMGRTLAVQFHPEATESIVRHWSSGDGATELTDTGIDRQQLLDRTRQMVDDVRGRTDALVSWFLRDVAQTHEN